MTKINPGFNAGHVMTAQLEFSRPQYADWSNVRPLLSSLLERIRTDPEVASAAVINYLPFGGLHENEPFAVDGDLSHENQTNLPVAEIRVVSPAYFKTMGIPILKGRDFSSSEFGYESDVIIINEAASGIFPREDVLGRYIRIQGSRHWREIIAVVGNVKRRSLSERAELYLYVPGPEGSTRSVFLVVRSLVSPERIAESIRRGVATLDASIPVFDTKPMKDRVQESLSFQWQLGALIGSFAIAALLLAAAGIFGLIALSVEQRTAELALRMALGASRREVLTLFGRRILVTTALGNLIGVLGSLAVARMIGRFLYDMSTIDPLMITIVAGVVFIVALMASYVPVRRATHMNITTALRCC